MNDSEQFNLVLGDGEVILKTYRPNKFRTFVGQIILWVIIGLLFIPLCVTAGYTEDGRFNNGVFIGALVGYLVVYGVCAAISFILLALWSKKTIYAVTNKRVLIRTGRIGVDYKSLDFSMLGAITVNVSWVDKLLHKNTGYIAFGSMSSPLTAQGGAKFNFSYIQNPYEVYKEVKAFIDSNKETKKD